MKFGTNTIYLKNVKNVQLFLCLKNILLPFFSNFSWFPHRELITQTYVMTITTKSIFFPQISKEYRLLKFCCVPTTSVTSSKPFPPFLLWPLTVLMKETRQAVRAIKQSILLICLWLGHNMQCPLHYSNFPEQKQSQQSSYIRCL